MATHIHKTAQLGDLITEAFDNAAEYSPDPREVARLATRAVMHMLARGSATLSSASRPARRTDARNSDLALNLR